MERYHGIGTAVTLKDTALKVRQGFIEGSNVNPVKAMVNMIEVNRAYEANQESNFKPGFTDRQTYK